MAPAGAAPVGEVAAPYIVGRAMLFPNCLKSRRGPAWGPTTARPEMWRTGRRHLPDAPE
jgi:hypothetical protein